MGTRVPLVDNAFFVLGLTPRARWPQVARAAEALLLALQAGDPGAEMYATPLGPQPRTVRAVQRARARLRDPDERIQHEIWWEAPSRQAAARTAADDAWPQALGAWGWCAR
ncbi:MAG: hypothetical protein K0V04_30315 [Deltaproteobacteria bacterium]|nr:hypothetical protein [Deltaproteobacteria bacterium]